MRISKLNTVQRTVVDSNRGLYNYLKGLETGRPATPHSWLYEWEDSEVTLKRWMQVLKQLEHGTPTEQLVYQFDLKQLEKFGAQGEVPPITEAIKVESFSDQYVLSPHVSIAFRPLSDILKLPKHSVLYRGFDAVLDDMMERDTLTTNSGWNLFTRRSTVRRESVIQAKNGKAWTFPAIILFRQYNGKLRVVWMYPMSMNLLEYQSTQPLQEVIGKSTRYVEPWKGFEDVKIRFTELWKRHPYAFGGDTTAMDAHMQTQQLTAVADAVADLFKDPTLMRNSLMHVSEIDMVVGTDAIIRDQIHGIASGSGWTQLSETIFQICQFDSYIRSRNLNLTVDDGMGIGDDYVWFFDEPVDSEDIVSFWEKVGLPGKPEKQSNAADHCTFLQRLFVKGYYSRDNKQVLGGVYPTIRALNSLLNPEKYHNPKDWNSDMFCIRCYMIMENVVDHPLFEQFVRFVVKGQKDLLPFAKKSASALRQIQKKARLIPGLTPSYNQEKREKPLSEFSSIKFAATL